MAQNRTANTYNLNCHLKFLLSNQTSSLQSHALIFTSGNSNNLFIASKVISLYASQ